MSEWDSEFGWEVEFRHEERRAQRAKLLTPPAQKPVAIHQFRAPHCADWYDGIPDHHDGHGPYEVRTLYTAPPAAQPDYRAVKTYHEGKPVYVSQPAQEPDDLTIAYMSGLYDGKKKRPWVGLTDEEKLDLISGAKGMGGKISGDAQLFVLLDEQEAKLKEKNFG
jgi:hypothetical protein